MSNRIKEQFKLFFETKWFLYFMALLTMLFWCLKTNYSQYIILCIIICLYIFVKASAKNFLAIIIFFEASLGKQEFITTSLGFIILVVIGVLTGIYILFKFINYIKKEDINKILKNPILLSLFILLGIMIISLFNSKAIWMSLGQIGVFSLNILFTVIALLFFKNSKENRNYFVFSIVIFMLIGSFQFYIATLEKYLTDPSGNNLIGILQTKSIRLGWIVGNHLTILMAMGIASAIYLILETEPVKNKLFYSLAIILGLLTILLTYSRSSLIALFTIFVLYFIYIVRYKHNKINKSIWIAFFAILIITIIVLLTTGLLQKYVLQIIHVGFNSNGREELWNLAITNFKNNWLIGTGWGTSKYYIQTILDKKEYNYHNYILQFTTCGILGVLGLANYIFQVFKGVSSKNSFCVLTMIILGSFLTQGLLDTVLFNKFFMPILSFMIIISFKEKNGVEL